MGESESLNLTVCQAMHKYNVAKHWILRRIKRGIFSVQKLGCKYIVDGNEIEKYLATHNVTKRRIQALRGDKIPRTVPVIMAMNNVITPKIDLRLVKDEMPERKTNPIDQHDEDMDDVLLGLQEAKMALLDEQMHGITNRPQAITLTQIETAILWRIDDLRIRQEREAEAA
jgi:hypothetical protein